jgi:hypothetical protein
MDKLLDRVLVVEDVVQPVSESLQNNGPLPSELLTSSRLTASCLLNFTCPIGPWLKPGMNGSSQILLLKANSIVASV